MCHNRQQIATNVEHYHHIVCENVALDKRSGTVCNPLEKFIAGTAIVKGYVRYHQSAMDGFIWYSEYKSL